MPEKPCIVIASFQAPAERELQIKRVSLGSWFESLTTSGQEPVRPEALEGRTGYLQSSPSATLRTNYAKQSEAPEIASPPAFRAMPDPRFGKLMMLFKPPSAAKGHEL